MCLVHMCLLLNHGGTSPYMLKPLQQDHAYALFKLFSKDDSIRFLDLPTHSLESFGRFINEVLAGEVLGLCLAKTIWQNDHLAGMIILSNISSEDGTAELGTWLGSEYRGKGLNEQAKKEMLKIAFNKFKLDAVLLISATDNLRSQKALAKLPYVHLNNKKYASIKKRQDFLFQHSFDIYEVLRSEFLKSSN